jgi:uncharacterized protein (DUF1697 family)
VNRYVAFLRGMNLGKRRIKNEELSAEFEHLGFAEVACFRASGNVVFAAENDDEIELTELIEAGLGEALGYAVPVFLRGEDELGEIAAQRPFESDLLAASKGKLQVALLPEKLGAAGRRQVLAYSSDEDRLTTDGRQLYWLPSGGISESDLDLKELEALAGPWTMRTKGTIEQLVAKYIAPTGG